jgi:TRAP-type uncharacterized transport system fused permease subunit
VSDDVIAAPSAPAGALRALETALASLLALGALAFALDLYRKIGFVFLAEQLLAASLGFGLALVYLRYPVKRRTPRARLPWYDALAGLVGFAASWYVAVRFPYFSENLYQVPADGIVVSAILYVLCVEGLRRTVGNALVVIVLVFSVYALVGHFFSGALQTRQVTPDRLIIDTALAIATAIGGIWLVSAGMIGFITRPLSLALRAGLLASGLALLVPHEITAWALWANVVAAPLAVLLVAAEFVAARRARAAPQVQP